MTPGSTPRVEPGSTPCVELGSAPRVEPGAAPCVNPSGSEPLVEPQIQPEIFERLFPCLGALFRRVDRSAKQHRLGAAGSSTELDDTSSEYSDPEREWHAFESFSNINTSTLNAILQDAERPSWPNRIQSAVGRSMGATAEVQKIIQTQMENDFPEVFEIEIPSADSRARIQADNGSDAGSVPPHAFLMGIVVLMLGGVISHTEMDQALGMASTASAGASANISAVLNGPLTSIIGGTPNVLHDGLISAHVGPAITGVMDAVRRESQIFATTVGNALGGESCDIMFDESFDWDGFLCSFSPF